MQMKRGKPLRKLHLRAMCCVLTLMLLLSCCGRHCYLCQGIPSDAPCLVDLSTGQVVEMTADNDPGAIIWTSLGGAQVSLDSNRASAIIPADDREMDRSLFCKDCQALLSELPDSGYVVADMLDPDNLSVYPVQANASYSMREYEVTVTTSSDGSHIEVTKDP